ncbi:hypothetical protein LshimejAT787_1205300 [Lyophyllum shimeji]|uniref:Cupredoxin n=1 Tax=Lyophyllum shimeji TaxID=47721 RepID=A0A9P3PXP5_LYOSH|nr:hypothetical protein LshimejAT787_1205300 [Lyophyllum shimeji]
MDTNPVWMFCQQTGHCGQGMVFAINAPADPDPKSFNAFQARAIAINGTATTAAQTTTSFVTPPAPHWQTATATVTWGSSIYTTTYTSYDGTPPPTPAPQPQDHKIVVGADGRLAYSPANITAAIGDTVTFEFHPKNHTVTQSSFLNPCKPLDQTSTTGQVGFKSGFVPVSADATEFPTFKITINDTAPIWGYCGQKNPVDHCASGMVFAINAVESGPNNFAAFLELAKRSGATSTSASGTSTGTGSPRPTSGAVMGSTVAISGWFGLIMALVFFALV